jgi:hypothetical protein
LSHLRTKQVLRRKVKLQYRQKLLPTPAAASGHNLEAAFHALDRNGDGVLDAAEFGVR